MRDICLPARWAFRDLVAAARAAEEHGIERVWCGDDLPEADAFVALAVLAGATKRVRLGAAGLNPSSRHPIVALGAALTLDELSGGRAFLAFAGEGDVLEEALALARAAAGGARTFEGRHFTLDNATYSWGRRELEVLAQPAELATPATVEEALRMVAA